MIPRTQFETHSSGQFCGSRDKENEGLRELKGCFRNTDLVVVNCGQLDLVKTGKLINWETIARAKT